MASIAQDLQAQHSHQDSPVLEPYGHNEEQASSLFEGNLYQPRCGATTHCLVHVAQNSHWVQQPLTHHGSIDTSVKVPDESRRRSLARYSDEIHASGFHGLESDRDCNFYSRGSPSFHTQSGNRNHTPPAPLVTSPSSDQSIANWNQQVALQGSETSSALAPSQVNFYSLSNLYTVLMLIVL